MASAGTLPKLKTSSIRTAVTAQPVAEDAKAGATRAKPLYYIPRLCRNSVYAQFQHCDGARPLGSSIPVLPELSNE